MPKIYFIMAYSAPESATQISFYIGPYKSSDEAKNRHKLICNSALMVGQQLIVTSFNAQSIQGSKIIIEGGRCFNVDHFASVSTSGELDDEEKEHFFPIDYFESATEFV